MKPKIEIVWKRPRGMPDHYFAYSGKNLLAIIELSNDRFLIGPGALPRIFLGGGANTLEKAKQKAERNLQKYFDSFVFTLPADEKR